MAQLCSTVLLTLLRASVLLAFPQRVQAYLDPGTGSYLVQVLIAGLLAGGLAVRLFWRNISGFLRRLFSRTDSTEGRADGA